MRLGFISDLHLDINVGFDISSALISCVKNKKIDALFIGGDTFNDAKKTLEYFRRMELILEIPIYTIFGNHEYYGDFFNERANNQKFPVRARGSTQILNIIGDTGWYDYSWGQGATLNQLRKGKTPHGSTWSDHRYIIWPKTNGDPATWFCELNLQSLKQQYEQIPRGEDIALLLHMVPHKHFLSMAPEHMTTNSYFGSERISQWIDEIKPKYVIYGHTHFPKDVLEKETEYICRSFGYYFEWSTENVKRRLNNLIFTIDI